MRHGTATAVFRWSSGGRSVNRDQRRALRPRPNRVPLRTSAMSSAAPSDRGRSCVLMPTGFTRNGSPGKRSTSAPSSGSTSEIRPRSMRESVLKTPASGAVGPWPAAIRLMRILSRASPIPVSATPSVMRWSLVFHTAVRWSNTRRDTGEVTRPLHRTSGTLWPR